MPSRQCKHIRAHGTVRRAGCTTYPCRMHDQNRRDGHVVRGQSSDCTGTIAGEGNARTLSSLGSIAHSGTTKENR